MKINGNTIKPGMVLQVNGGLWVVTKASHVKPGKGGAFANVEAKNLETGNKLNERFRSEDKVERVTLEQKPYQFEGEGTETNPYKINSLADLKGTLFAFAQEMFGQHTKVHFRPSFFPYTEPSAEMDVTCFVCGGTGRTADGSGCGVCKRTGWLEILGSGMVHPRVLANCGLDAREWQGFAFGMGIERITMLKHGMADLRPFFEGDTRWLSHYASSPLAAASLHEGV